MKHLTNFLLIAIFSLISTTKISAVETWLDVDFSNAEWTVALEEAGLILVDDIASIGDELSTFAFKPGTYGDIEGVQGFYLNGHWSAKWVVTPIIGVDGRTITQSIRLRKDSPSYVQLPKLANAGKVSVYVKNSNTTSSTNFDIEKLEDDNTTWTKLTTLTTVGSSLYADGAVEEKLEFEVNSSTPITLRVYKNSARFMNVFRVVVEKYSPSGIKSNFSNLLNISIKDKTLYIISDKIEVNHLQLIDLSGRQVWQTLTSEKQLQLPASMQQGMYIVRLSNEHGSLSQSVVIQ
jgi:hypothetical protein